MLLALAQSAQQELAASRGRLAHLWRAYQSLHAASLSAAHTCTHAPPEAPAPSSKPAAEDVAHPSPQTAGGASVLQQFLTTNAVTTPVKDLRGLPQPTALSWLKRKALPDVPASAIFKAFRQCQVRASDGKRVWRVKRQHLLDEGHTLLFPRELLQLQQQIRQRGGASRDRPEKQTQPSTVSGGQPRGLQVTVDPQNGSATAQLGSQQGVPAAEAGKAGRRSATSSEQGTQTGTARRIDTRIEQGSGSSVLGSQGSDASDDDKRYQLMPRALPGMVDPYRVTPLMLRRNILKVSQHAVFINKPAGLPVQGPGPSIDRLVNQGLKLRPDEQLRLVHRLDKNVSGVLALARTRDAAAWLSACFKEKDVPPEELQASEDGEEPSPAMGVQRVYWALLAGTVEGRRKGRIRMSVISNNRFRDAITEYKVKHTSPLGVTWVELRPITGCKHQLRRHCAVGLGAPIIGDIKYGYRGLEPGKKLGPRLPAAWWHAFSAETAERATNPLTRRERRQMAAQAALERARLKARGDAESDSDSEETDDHDLRSRDKQHDSVASRRGGEDARYDRRRLRRRGEDDEGASREVGERESGEPVRPMPLFLHARRMVVKLPGQDAVRVRAPVPVYMADVIDGLGWKLPAE